MVASIGWADLAEEFESDGVRSSFEEPPLNDSFLSGVGASGAGFRKEDEDDEIGGRKPIALAAFTCASMLSLLSGASRFFALDKEAVAEAGLDMLSAMARLKRVSSGQYLLQSASLISHGV